ncbi:MAG: radical SAM protein [Candidatus Omnitrophica bacterium]|nr:radical SAM protein [Candidatus Omnitrophota bacterium]
MRINELGIVITYKCNSQCRMCNIWKRSEGDELEAKYFSRLPEDLKIIGLTGGEPFLREDIVEVYRLIRKQCPAAKITLGSNGMATDLITRYMLDILKFDKNANVIISLDGIGKMHDRMRGVEGAFVRVMHTIESLKKIGLRGLGLNFTISEENLGEMKDVYDLSRKLNLKISFVLAHNSEIYYRTDNKPLENLTLLGAQLNYIIGKELGSFNIKRWLKAYYLGGIFDFAKYGRRRCKCSAGLFTLFVDANGDIYPCLKLNKRIGNLKDFDFEKIDKLQMRRWTGQCPDPCWLGCSVYPVLRKRPYLALGWLVKAKLKSVFGLRTLDG